MKRSAFFFLLAICSLIVSAQTDFARMKRPLRVWVYTKDNKEQQGILTGGTDTTVIIYPGSMKEYKKQPTPQLVSISYENIDIIKTKKASGLLGGLAKGALIGLTPAVFGEGGAYVAVFAFPLGVITGGIVGATSKKKYVINDDLNAFQKFTRRVIK